MKKLISLCLAVLMITLIFAGCKNKGQVEKEIPSDISDFPMANNIDGNYVATDYKYNFYKDVLKLSDAPEIKLEPSPIIPNNINGSSVEYYKYINKTEAFVALEKEVGSYNLKTQNYNKFFSIPDKASAIIIAYNTDHIVYDLNYHNDKLAGQLTDVDNRELWIYNIKTKDNRLVHTYNKASINSMAQAKNNNLIFNGKLYFNDTVSKKDHELDIVDMDLYVVDLKSGKSQLYKKSAQNPIVYKGKIYVIVRGEDGKFNTITSLDGKESFKLQYGIRELCPTDKGILQCVTVEPEKEEQVSNSRLYLDTQNKDIVFTNVYMGNFVNNRKYVMWSVSANSAGGCYVYSVDRDKFINIYPIEESKNTTYSVGMALDGTFFVYTVEYDKRGEIASSNNFTVSFEE